MSMFVFLPVSVQKHICRTTRPIFTEFLLFGPGGPPVAALHTAIRYVLSVMDDVMFAHNGHV